MNDQILNEAYSMGPMKTWLQMIPWLEWMQPFLYCLLAIALASLLFTLLDLAMLCWKEFHPAAAQETTKARTKAAPVSEARETPSAARRLFSHL